MLQRGPQQGWDLSTWRTFHSLAGAVPICGRSLLTRTFFSRAFLPICFSSPSPAVVVVSDTNFDSLPLNGTDPVPFVCHVEGCAGGQQCGWMHAYFVLVFCTNLQRRMRQGSPVISWEPVSMSILKEWSRIEVGQPERIPHEPGSDSTNPYGEDEPLGRVGSLSAANSCPKANFQGDQKSVLGNWGRKLEQELCWTGQCFRKHCRQVGLGGLEENLSAPIQEHGSYG